MPVCAAPEAGGGKAHKRSRDASPHGVGAAAADVVVDERAIDSALHPSAQDDSAAEDLHSQARPAAASSWQSQQLLKQSPLES